MILLVAVFMLGISVAAVAEGQIFFQYSNLAVSPTPAIIEIGKPITVKAVVKNVGGYEGTTTANLFVDGYLVSSKK